MNEKRESLFIKEVSLLHMPLLRVSCHKEAPGFLFLPDNVCHSTFTVLPLYCVRGNKKYVFDSKDPMLPSGEYHFQYLFCLSLKGAICLPLDNFSFDSFLHYQKYECIKLYDNFLVVSGKKHKIGTYHFNFQHFSKSSDKVREFAKSFIESNFKDFELKTLEE